jgi:hypothetical protein
VSKKTEKPRKPEKPNREKKPIKILKKPTSSVRFLFYKSETEKIESNRTQAEKTRKKSRAKPEKTEQGLNRFRFF